VTFDSWFYEPGAYVLVDGQFGSTGKGLLASYITEKAGDRITHITTNAGPNSGHTAYYNMWGGEEKKIVTQQIPVASVICSMRDFSPITLLNAGAVINPSILAREVVEYGIDPRKILVHPCAAMISDSDRQEDETAVAGIASTGKGVGPAIARKVLRRGYQAARHYYMPMLPSGRDSWDSFWDWTKDKVFVETAQGFSLGLNSARFYPWTTSRECTVMQAISDARIPAQMVKGVVACYRTFPIRVGNTEATSGDCYPDQVETTWEELGLEPEFTTVTKRKRRVFTWSRTQFRESVAANRPEILFINFMQYLPRDKRVAFLRDVTGDYVRIMGHAPTRILIGMGPRIGDIYD
jgi:adenylosuccinate synthase